MDVDIDNDQVVESLNWVIGVVLCVSATAVGTTGRIFLRWSHILKETSEKRQSLIILILGIIFLIINPAMDVLSFAYASPTLLTPLSGTTLIWNVVFARFILDEKETAYAVGGSAVALCGCVMVAVYGPKEDPTFAHYDEVMALFHRKAFHVYILCWLVVIAMLFTLVQTGARFVRGVSYALLAGAFSGLFFSLKCSVELIKLGAFNHLFTYFIMLSAAATPVVGILILYIGLKSYDALVLLPLYHAALVLTGVTSSAIFFDDLQSLSSTRVFLFAVAISIIVIGAIIISLHGLVQDTSDEKVNLLKKEIPVHDGLSLEIAE